MESPGWTSVAEALNDLDFPATRQQIVDHALDKRANDALRLLRGLPVETYRNIAEVRRSVPPDPAADGGRSAADQAARAGSPHPERSTEHRRRSDD